MRNFLLLVLLPVLFFMSCNGDDPVEIPESLPDNHVNAIYVTEDGLKYFATDKGLASFDGLDWTVYYDNPKITAKVINDLDFELTNYGPEFWLATNEGVNVISLPVDATSGATTYTKNNTKTIFGVQTGLIGDNVHAVRVDNKHIRWFGTSDGISAFQGDQWPEIGLHSDYGGNFFKNHQITSIDFSNDTIYIGTKGGGIARMIAPSADAISGASAWQSPWNGLPSNHVLAVFTDGHVQWYGTDLGLVKHTGIRAKDGWELFGEFSGMASDYVQAINKDLSGKMWFGTDNGVSSYDGNTWVNYSETDGLISNNVLCIAVDIDGSLWFGTDNGVSHLNGSTWKSYQAE